MTSRTRWILYYIAVFMMALAGNLSDMAHGPQWDCGLMIGAVGIMLGIIADIFVNH